MPIDPEQLKKLHQALGLRLRPDQLLDSTAERIAYAIDNSRRQGRADLIVMPESHDEVAEVMRLSHQHGVTVVTRGRGTGTTGAAVPLDGGLVLVTERLNRVIKTDPANRAMVVQPGVTNQTVQETAGAAGFFWPPDPTSSAVCTVGGNLACNSAGPRAVKYGTPRDNTLGLRAVTADGRSLHTGVYTTKGVVGYDLTRLLIGSEGTLAVITEATLRLTPLAETKRTLRALYRDIGQAAEAVARIMAQPVTPCALEFMDRRAIEMIRGYSSVEVPSGVGALLMIEVDGAAACIDEAAQAVSTAAQTEGCIDLRVAADREEVAQLWAMRKALSPALRTVAPKKINEDVVVPVSRIPALIEGLERLGARHGITIVNFGHAGNGNIHVNLLVDPDDAVQMRAATPCLHEVFDLVLNLGGTLSGEHGIGLVKREFVARELDPVALELMQGIKRQFDPKGILNPGKTLPGI